MYYGLLTIAGTGKKVQHYKIKTFAEYMSFIFSQLSENVSHRCLVYAFSYKQRTFLNKGLDSLSQLLNEFLSFVLKDNS